MIIVAEHSFFLLDKQISMNAIETALELYEASHNCNAVRLAVDKAFDEDDCYPYAKRLLQIALENRLGAQHFRIHFP
jgi:hypothetical protein